MTNPNPNQKIPFGTRFFNWMKEHLLITTLFLPGVLGFILVTIYFLTRSLSSSGSSILSPDILLFVGFLGGYTVIFPILVTIENVYFLFYKQTYGKKAKETRFAIQSFTLLSGALLSFLFLNFEITNVRIQDYPVQLYNSQIHTPLATWTLPTILLLVGVAILAFVLLRSIPVKNQPPLLTVFGFGALYVGCFENIVWCIQLLPHMDECFPLFVLPLNFLLISASVVKDVVVERMSLPQDENQKLSGLSHFLHDATKWPWLGFIAALPILGILLGILILFGQSPSSVIDAWTQTANWTLSQQTAPPNVAYDEHYLCTVAAGGDEEIVKPFRTGKRHGHEVLVNRQLCIANAFEQLLEERTPHFHQVVRGLYDKTGYPVAKHIRSKKVADVIYVLMKPLEWFFLLVLYLFDAHPENRIAVQYPHAPLPSSIVL